MGTHSNNQKGDIIPPIPVFSRQNLIELFKLYEKFVYK